MYVDDSSVQPAPELESLTLTRLTIRPELEQELFDVLGERGGDEIMESLVVRSCGVYDGGIREQLEELVAKLTWDGVYQVAVTDSEDSEESEDYEGDDFHGCM